MNWNHLDPKCALLVEEHMNIKRVDLKIKPHVIHGKTYIVLGGEIHVLCMGRWTPIDKTRIKRSNYKDFAK